MSETELTILLSARHDEGLAERIHQFAPAARILSREDLDHDPDAIAEVEVVYGGLKAEFFPRAGRLRWLQSTGAGAGWAQRPEVRDHPVVVTNAHIHADQIAEHLFGLLLMLNHRLHETYLLQRDQQWQAPPTARTITTLPGRRLCVLGLGVIGRRCAMLGAAHGMEVVGLRRHPRPDEHCRAVYGVDRLEEALTGAEVVMNLLPGASATAKLIGRGQLELLADGAVFLNAGRGSTVDTDALVEALRSGKLAGAGLDVVDPEPLPPGHPLWTTPNVLITPHYAGLVADYHARAERVFLANLRRYLAGRPLQGVVDKEAGY
jgi:D-2-hydroxyacid dehydrogenase (NADP+)